MFSFLNGSVLFAAAAALIPLIIHLFSRRRVKVVEFSSIRHLKAMQKRQVRRLKIRQLLLLVLRMLIILCIVLAFARPTMRSGSIGAHAAVSAVVLYDNSASMNREVADGNLTDIARKRTAELLASFSQADQVALVPLDPTTDPPPATFASAAVAQEQLARLPIGAGEADFQTALNVAHDLLANAPSLNRELYVISDRQRHALPEKPVALDSVARVYLVDLPLQDNDDLGITAVDFGGQLIQPGLDFNITVTVQNYGAEPATDLLASLFIDDKRVAQTGFSVGAGAETGVRFTQAVSRTGFHAGYIEISDDKFLGDNRYYFSFRIADRFNVLLVDSDQSARFISLALAPSPALTQAWSIKQATPADLPGINLGDYDVIVLAGAPNLGDLFTDRIKSFVRTGKSLFFVYGPNTDITAFNRSWSDITGVTFEQAVPTSFTRAGYYTLQSLTMEHPIFSVFGFEKNKPPEIRFYTLPKVRIAASARQLMTFTGDHPALIENRVGGGKVLTFAAPMSPEYTDLPGQAFFVPFISRTAEYLASDLSSLDTRLYVGDNIVRSPVLRGTPAYAIQLTTPDQREYDLSPEESHGALTVVARPTSRPGLYALRYLGDEIDRFAVNLRPAECDLSGVDPDQFATGLGAPSFHALPVAEPLAASIASLRFGRELWQLFVWAAVIFLILEMLLARSAPPEE